MTLADHRAADARGERYLIRGTLLARGWRLGATAEALDIWPRQLQRLIDQHGLREEYDTQKPGRPKPAV